MALKSSLTPDQVKAFWMNAFDDFLAGIPAAKDPAPGVLSGRTTGRFQRAQPGAKQDRGPENDSWTVGSWTVSRRIEDWIPLLVASFYAIGILVCIALLASRAW